MLGFGAMPFLNAAACGEPGVFDDQIVFGQSAAFDGPAAALGLGMREGILAAFNEVNAASGISGHKLELVSHDDSYDPDKAIANTKRLILKLASCARDVTSRPRIAGDEFLTNRI
jgi:ABC-type branched-subunit amino acid transport system substrate-binding protein